VKDPGVSGLRLLLVSFIDDSRATGMGRWTHGIAEGLHQLGHVATSWFMGDFPKVARTGRLAVLLLPIALALRLRRDGARFDAVLIHEPTGFWYGLLRKCRPNLPPMILICHNVESRYFADLGRAAAAGAAILPLGMRLKTPIFRLWQSDGAIGLADHVVCLSTVDCDYVVRHLGRRPDTVTRMTNGVASDSFTRPGRSHDGCRVLFVGGWLDVKGRRLLPRIWSAVRAKRPDATLTLVGVGSDAVLAEFDSGDRATVTVVDHLLDEAAMAAVYAVHDVLLVASISEGCPLAVLEAMAAGLPVVAPIVGGIPDIVTNGVSAALYNPLDVDGAAEATCRVLEDPEGAAALGAAAHTAACRLTWRASAATIATAAKQLIEACTVTQTGSVKSR
jgi:glycosyltransferase involved in cell wall biosynthesis